MICLNYRLLKVFLLRKVPHKSALPCPRREQLLRAALALMLMRTCVLTAWCFPSGVRWAR